MCRLNRGSTAICHNKLKSHKTVFIVWIKKTKQKNKDKLWKLRLCSLPKVHSKKCWVKYNPVLGKIWTNPAIGLFRPSGWVTAQKVFFYSTNYAEISFNIQKAKLKLMKYMQLISSTLQNPKASHLSKIIQLTSYLWRSVRLRSFFPSASFISEAVSMIACSTETRHDIMASCGSLWKSSPHFSG